MTKYIITYTRGDSSLARAFKVSAESEGEACELFDEFADGCDEIEFVSIRKA